MFDIVGRRKWFFLISLCLMLPALIFLPLGGLKLGIDFTGGTLWEVQFNKPVETLQVRSVLADNGYPNTAVQAVQGNAVQIRGPELKEGSGLKDSLANALRAQFGDFTELQIQTVGPTVGTSISQRAIGAVLLTSVGILLYLAYAFRQAPHPFRYGVCAIIGMLHDVIAVIGVFALLGYFFNIEIDSLFVTALLTVIGFSVHDTIVVFDRIRENTLRRTGDTFEQTVNYSLLQTLVRSLNTSLTVVFTLLALYLFGGESIKNFILALLIGMISGTYSSIFNASLLLVVWERGDLDRFFRRGRRGRRAPETATA